MGVSVPKGHIVQQQTYEQHSASQVLKFEENGQNSGPVSCAHSRINLPVSCSPGIVQCTLGRANSLPISRASGAMHRGQISSLMLALQFAIAQGLAPNRFQTINLQRGGRKGRAALSALQLLIKTQREWVKSRGGVFAAIWVREVGPVVGEHVHILLHIPADLERDFFVKMRGWRRIFGSRRGTGLVKTMKIRYLHGDRFDQRNSEQNLQAVLNYMLKGCDQISQRENPQLPQRDCGVIEGKRCGYTQNLGPAERSRNAWEA